MSKASGSLPPNDELYAPSLKRRVRKGDAARYFIVPTKDVKAGYPVNIRTIPKNATEKEAAALCREWWEELKAWREGRPKPISYTFSWLIDRYLYDSRSPYNQKHPATRENYKWHCKALKVAIGHLHFDPVVEFSGTSRVIGSDIREWHEGFGCPVTEIDASGREIKLASAPSRARHMIMMLRTIVSYGVEIGAPGAGDLRQRLSAMNFPTPPARTQAPTFEQVDRLVTFAEKMGWRSIAITTLAQYELIERRVHIIGQWDKDLWMPGWVWEGISPDWIIKYTQTKRGIVLREFDLRANQRLLSMLQETPKEARQGPVIRCETTGQPWHRRYYAEIFREIAKAAGIPDDICSMDMRAGGATEADSIHGVSDRALQDAGGWRDPKTPHRYRRSKQRNAQNVFELRQASRDKK
jgi:hypothetical protein